MMFKDVVVYFVLLCFTSAQKYEIPEPTIEILHPKGFTVSIPDQEGIELFQFHGKLNEEFDGPELGYFSRDVTAPVNGKWTYYDKFARFNVGDVIYYWLYVDYFDGRQKLGYVRENQKYVVRDAPKNNGNKGNKGNNNGNKGNKGNQNGHGNQGNQYESTHAPTLRPTIATTKPTAPPTIATPKPVCNDSPSKINGRSPCSGELVFNEDFNSLNANRWESEIKFADDPDYEFVIYGTDTENLNIDNGQLHIKPTLGDDRYGAGFVTIQGGLDLGVNCTGIPDSLDCKQVPSPPIILPPVLSGRINSKPSFSFLYGRIDIKAKLPKGDWIYPELFLTPKKFEYGDHDYASGEIRIAFLPGNADLNKELEGGILLGVSDEVRKYGMRKLKSETSWSADFHVFSVIWKSGGVTLLVDNKVYGNIHPPPGGFANALSKHNLEAALKWKTGDVVAPFDKEMFITVGVGVGGHSFPDSLPGKLYNNVDSKGQYRFYRAKDTWYPTWSEESQLIVDYIKVYAL